MPKWWPWARSKHPDPELAAPATRPAPAWHRLPAVQRTIEDTETTAHLQGFAESLTTSQNPGITGSLELLSTGQADRLSVLDVAHHSSGASARPTNAPVAPTPQKRTWAPSPMVVQRALRSTASVQRADEITPVREIGSVEATAHPVGPPHSMVQAPPPDDRRILGVANEQEIEANEPQSVSVLAPEPAPIDHHSRTVTEDPPSPAAQPTPSPVSTPPFSASPPVQRLSSSADGVPATAPQTILANSLGSADISLTPPPRHLPSLQRAATGSDAAPQSFTVGRPIPMLRTITSPGSQPSPRKPDTIIPNAVGDIGNAVQRWIDPDPTRAATTAATTPLTSDPLPPSMPSESQGDLPVARTAEAKQSTTAPPPATAQRVMTNSGERNPAPQTQNSPASDVVAQSPPDVVTQSLPDVDGQSVPAVESPRLPMAQPRPDVTVAVAEPERQISTMSAVQRIPSVVSTRRLPGPALDVVVQSLPDVDGQSIPAVESPRLPMAQPRPDVTVASAEPERPASTMSTVQRTPSAASAHPLPERSAHTFPQIHVEADKTPGPSGSLGESPASRAYHLQRATQKAATWEPPSERQSEVAWASIPERGSDVTEPSTAEGRSASGGNATPQVFSDATPMLQALSHAAEEHAAPTTPQPAVMQRVTSPVVEPTSALHRTGSPVEPSHPDTPVSPVVQRAAATGRRLVVLPPLRRSATTSHDGPDSSHSAPERSVLFDSPRPVGLQRMFGDNAMRTDRGTGFGSASPGSAGFVPAAFGSGESSSDPTSGVPQFDTSGPRYDPSTNPITFASPTIQREAEAAPPPESEPATAQAPSSPSGPAPSGPAAASPAGGGDVEELVNKLYDPLAARLRAELWLDRERAGVLMDLGR